VQHKANRAPDSATEPNREEMIAAIRRIISEDGDEKILELTREQLIGSEPNLGAAEEILELTVNEEEILELTTECGGLPSQDKDDAAKGLRVSANPREMTTKLRNAEHPEPEGVAKSPPANEIGSSGQHVRTGSAETSPEPVRSEAGAKAVSTGKSIPQSATKVRSPSEEATFSLEQAIAALRATQGLAPLKREDAKEKVPRPNLEQKKPRPSRGEKEPAAVLGLRARLEYDLSIKPLIQQLTLQDFELLISLILERTGWLRASGGDDSEKRMEFQVENCAVDEKILVQVKKSATQSNLNDSAERFRGAPEYAHLIFAVQSAADVLVCPEVPRPIHVWDCDRLARLISQLGLGEWVEKKLA
jgi:hypothetical protein